MFFLLAYLWLSVRRVLVWSPVAAAAAMAVFLLVVFAAGQFGYILNGALFYSPALLMLLALTIAHWDRHGDYVTMMGATIVFVFALAFRTLDNTICPMLPVGTHFLWHLFNAVAAFYATRALLLYPTHISEATQRQS
jgi:hypothetical protein